MQQTFTQDQEDCLNILRETAKSYGYSLTDLDKRLWLGVFRFYGLTGPEFSRLCMQHRISERGRFMLQPSDITYPKNTADLRYAMNQLYRQADHTVCLLFPNPAMAVSFEEEFGDYQYIDYNASEYEKNEHYKHWRNFYEQAIVSNVQHPCWLYGNLKQDPSAFVYLGRGDNKQLLAKAIKEITARNSKYQIALPSPKEAQELAQQAKDFFDSFMGVVHE